MGGPETHTFSTRTVGAKKASEGTRQRLLTPILFKFMTSAGNALAATPGCVSLRHAWAFLVVLQATDKHQTTFAAPPDVAKALHIPRETARRYLQNLVQAGLCADLGHSRLQTSSSQLSCQARQAIEGFVEREFRLLWHRAHEAGALAEAKYPQNRSRSSTTDLSNTVEAGIALLLQFTQVAHKLHNQDLERSRVFNALVVLSRRFTREAVERTGLRNTKRHNGASVREISKLLGIPYETARRHVRALAKDKLSVRTGATTVELPENPFADARFNEATLMMTRHFMRAVSRGIYESPSPLAQKANLPVPEAQARKNHARATRC